MVGVSFVPVQFNLRKEQPNQVVEDPPPAAASHAVREATLAAGSAAASLRAEVVLSQNVPPVADHAVQGGSQCFGAASCANSVNWASQQ